MISCLPVYNYAIFVFVALHCLVFLGNTKMYTTLCFQYTIHLSRSLAARKHLYLADSLSMRIQPSLRDRFHIMETQYIIAQPTCVHYFTVLVRPSGP